MPSQGALKDLFVGLTLQPASSHSQSLASVGGSTDQESITVLQSDSSWKTLLLDYMSFKTLLSTLVANWGTGASTNCSVPVLSHPCFYHKTVCCLSKEGFSSLLWLEAGLCSNELLNNDCWQLTKDILHILWLHHVVFQIWLSNIEMTVKVKKQQQTLRRDRMWPPASKGGKYECMWGQTRSMKCQCLCSIILEQINVFAPGLCKMIELNLEFNVLTNF